MMTRIFIAILALLFLSPAALAAGTPSEKSAPPLVMLTRYEQSHPERFLMAYYKLANQEPNIAGWAEKSTFLTNTTPPAERDSIINRENNRLRQDFAGYDREEPLVVHTNLILDDYSTIQEVLNLSEFTPRTFFNFSIYGERVAIVPQEITEFSKIALTKTQMDDMLKKAGQGSVMAELLLKPIGVDTREPYVENGKDYHLMLAKIAEIRFWGTGNSKELLWMQRAEWYKPEADAALLQLKGGL